MNAIAKKRGLSPVTAVLASRPMEASPATLAHWATALDASYGFDAEPGGSKNAGLAEQASRTADQTFDLLLDLPPTNTEDCLAQLVVLVNRFRLASMSDSAAMASLVYALASKLERTTLALARIDGSDPMPLGGVLFFYPAAAVAAGFPSPYDKEPAR